jgi:hypothetical protein
VSEEQLHPYDDPYAAQIVRIRDLLDEGVPVMVIHNEFATRKELVITPRTAMAEFGNTYGLGGENYWHLSWSYTGSMWVPASGRADYSYIAEKLDIYKWIDDAKSIEAFIKSLAERTVVRAKEV